MAEPNDDVPGEGIEGTKQRSPNYPMFGLQKAIERTGEVFNKYKRATVPVNLIHSLWEYKEHSGTGNRAVAALKAYGLLDVEGDGKNRRVRLTDAAYRIVMNSADREAQLKKAATAPAIFRELWDQYRGEEHFPDDDLIRHYLIWDREGVRFNADVVDGLIQNFRETFRYAGLLPGGIVQGESPPTPHGQTRDSGTPAGGRPKVGDLVQWTCNGQDMYPEPRRVQGLYDDEYTYVEGSPTGVLISELTIVEPKTTSPEQPKPAAKAPPPTNPFMNPAPPKPSREERSATTEFKEDAYDLAEGPAVLRWPAKLDPASVGELEEWFKLIIKKMKRITRLVPVTVQEAAKTTAPLIPGGPTCVLKVEGFPEDD